MSQESPSEDLIRFAERPSHLIDGMITIREPTPSIITAVPRSRPSALGTLGMLPLELLHQVMENLDFLSLFHLRRVSFCGKDVVESLPAYHELVKYASYALKALSLTNLIGFHPATKLRATLRSSDCVSCREFGPFLFLPTCERCCYTCLSYNPSLWVISRTLACKYFSLTPRELKEIPALTSIPGSYYIRHTISRRRKLKLVSVKMAKDLKIKLHGNTFHSRPPGFYIGASDKELTQAFTVDWCREASTQILLNKDPPQYPSMGEIPNDDYCGMASVPFPYLLADHTADDGFWCCGCAWVFRESSKLPLCIQNKMVPPGYDPYWVLKRHSYRARLKKDYLVHAASCYGVKNLLLTPNDW